MRDYTLLTILSISLFTFSTNLKSQIDTTNIGDIVTAPRIKTLNDWRSCNIQTDKDKLIKDSLDMYNDFYNRLIHDYSSNSRCAFLRMWNQEISRNNYVYEKIADELFVHKPYNDNYAISDDLVLVLNKYLMRVIKKSCSYFDNVDQE